jgi:hypothetical protein
MTRALKIRPYVKSIFDPDGAVLLDLQKGKYYSLNAVGTQIWKKLEEGSSPPEIVDHLAAFFRAPLERVQIDFEAFVNHLENKGLIHVRS